MLCSHDHVPLLDLRSFAELVVVFLKRVLKLPRFRKLTFCFLPKSHHFASSGEDAGHEQTHTCNMHTHTYTYTNVMPSRA